MYSNGMSYGGLAEDFTVHSQANDKEGKREASTHSKRAAGGADLKTAGQQLHEESFATAGGGEIKSVHKPSDKSEPFKTMVRQQLSGQTTPKFNLAII